MSENNEKPKDIEDLDLPNKEFNDLNELMEWMASPRVYWENFKVTIPIKKRSDIKWIALNVEEA